MFCVWKIGGNNKYSICPLVSLVGWNQVQSPLHLGGLGIGASSTCGVRALHSCCVGADSLEPTRRDHRPACRNRSTSSSRHLP
jgi:hypothetical protein